MRDTSAQMSHGSLCQKLMVIKISKMGVNVCLQGRRRHFESGTALERRRRSTSAEGTSGGEHERGYVPLSLGENFVIKYD